MIKLDKIDINFINSEINNKGHCKVLDELLHSLDVTRHLPDGMRITATTYYTYHADLARYDYTIKDAVAKNILSNEQYNLYCNKFNERIAANLEYEKLNPPINPYKDGKRKISKNPRSTRKARTTDMFTGEITISTINDKGGIVRSKKIKMPEGKLVFNFNKK
jgi:hypothetical protein